MLKVKGLGIFLQLWPSKDGIRHLDNNEGGVEQVIIYLFYYNKNYFF